MENKIQVQDHSQEILSVIRSNASPGILRTNWKITMKTTLLTFSRN
mgnify:CR=1 FL=1